MLAKCSVSWGNLEMICDRLRVSLPSLFKSRSGLTETVAETDMEAETQAIAEAEAGAGAVTEAVRRFIL